MLGGRIMALTRFSVSFFQELFSSTVGPTKEVVLTYDAKGNSKGVASVTFNRRGDANKAFKQYNGRLVDGS